MQARNAPGAHVVIRDCERIVRRSDPRDERGCVGTNHTTGIRALYDLKQSYFALRHKFKTERSDSERICFHHDFFEVLASTPGIPSQPENRALPPNTELPLLSALADITAVQFVGLLLHLRGKY